MVDALQKGSFTSELAKSQTLTTQVEKHEQFTCSLRKMRHQIFKEKPLKVEWRPWDSMGWLLQLPFHTEGPVAETEAHSSGVRVLLETDLHATEPKYNSENLQ